MVQQQRATLPYFTRTGNSLSACRPLARTTRKAQSMTGIMTFHLISKLFAVLNGSICRLEMGQIMSLHVCSLFL